MLGRTGKGGDSGGGKELKGLVSIISAGGGSGLLLQLLACLRWRHGRRTPGAIVDICVEYVGVTDQEEVGGVQSFSGHEPGCSIRSLHPQSEENC